MAAEPAGPRRRLRPSTMRARTTMAATVVMAVTVLLGSVALSTVLYRSLVHNLDKVAELRADDIAALAREGALPDALAIEEEAVAQVVDSRGRVIASSANVRGRAPVSTLAPGDDEPVMRTIGDIPGVTDDAPFRLLAKTTDTGDGPVTIYVATSLEPAEETIDFLRSSLLLGGPLLVALVAALTWVTVGRALRPVEAIRAQVAEISSRDLSRRVPVPETDDEIRRLAGTMNGMLGRLETAVERQRRFVADASHELQSPLAAARTDLEVALAHPDAAEWTDVARDLLEENRRMERLVADLLYVARADESGVPAAPAGPIDLGDVVLEETARVFGSNRVGVDTRGVTGAVVSGRRDELCRVVRNLLDNAARHASSGVTVELQTAGDTVTLVVEDDGPGVAPEDRERIFERFARVDDARSRGTGGTGLGLAIVREIVGRHAGRVAIEDGSSGARFVVRLPAD
jgi:heavy metal sensor kinase